MLFCSTNVSSHLFASNEKTTQGISAVMKFVGLSLLYSELSNVLWCYLAYSYLGFKVFSVATSMKPRLRRL